MMPLVLACAGTWLTRSGAARSVHAFAEARAVGWWTGLLTILVLLGTVWYAVRAGKAPAAWRPGRLVTLNLITVGATLAVVAAGTFAPVAVQVAGGAPSRVEPSFFASMLRPVAVLAAAGATFAAVWKVSARRRSWSQLLAHGGFVVLLVGVGGSALGGHTSVVARPGETAQVLGRTFVYDGVEGESIVDGDVVVAHVKIDGVSLEPSLTRFTSSGQLLAETATYRRWWGDVQVVLTRRLPGNAASFDVHVAPLQSLVWVGALLITAGAAGSVRSIKRDRASVRTRPAFVGAAVPGSTVPAPDLPAEHRPPPDPAGHAEPDAPPLEVAPG